MQFNMLSFQKTTTWYLRSLIVCSSRGQFRGSLDKDKLTHWGRVTHICVSKLTIIGSDNGLSPGRRQAIIWTNAGILLIGPLGTNFSDILIEILTFSFTKMRLKVSSAKWRPFCLGLNVLILKFEHGWGITSHGFVTIHSCNKCSPVWNKSTAKVVV